MAWETPCDRLPLCLHFQRRLQAELLPVEVLEGCGDELGLCIRFGNDNTHCEVPLRWIHPNRHPLLLCLPIDDLQHQLHHAHKVQFHVLADKELAPGPFSHAWCVRLPHLWGRGVLSKQLEATLLRLHVPADLPTDRSFLFG